jgi:predicted transcriptional regulator
VLNKWEWLKKWAGKSSPAQTTARSDQFIDLTPTDNADPGGTYAVALEFALNNPRVKNIALTGPYGSGKSSIIQTFAARTRYRFLNISLASFQEQEDTAQVDGRAIERSILQQMLYGTDANRLPYSRFKRIVTPAAPFLTATMILAWGILTAYIFHNIELFTHLESFQKLHWAWYAALAYVGFVSAKIISTAYKSSFSLSLKKLSLKNAEIETGDISEDSILNRHLDEIIYFFQRTRCDVVVIEDLDRFGQPEIFVKLREINKLINDNLTAHGFWHNIKRWLFNSKQPLKFLYALKDDMFLHKNRAKFFDFLIPVVPVINTSNSLDKIQVRLREFDFAHKIESQFLREVSLYIDDLRLIHNIFNELAIYYDQLKSNSLNVTKLLAIVLYKNAYPNDFENLHHEKGALFSICSARDRYIQEKREEYDAQISDLQAQIEAANKEQVRSIEELIAIYLWNIVKRDPQSIAGFRIKNQEISLVNASTLATFESLIGEENISVYSVDPYNQRQRRHLNISFAQLEEKINPGETFMDRKANIENSASQRRQSLKSRILDLKEDAKQIPLLPLHRLTQENSINLQKILTDNQIFDKRLLTYLIQNGHLDDTYHLYTSAFHEGRWTRRDRDFILAIYNFEQPPPDQKIDTPAEICKNMREEHFGEKYVLNVDLFDYLLDNQDANQRHIQSAFQFIERDFETAASFLLTYLSTGEYSAILVSAVSKAWPGLAHAAIHSDSAPDFIMAILQHVPGDYIQSEMNSDNVLTDYISEHGHVFLAADSATSLDYDPLELLQVRFKNLEELEKNPALIEYAAKKRLYAINPINILYLIKRASPNLQPSPEQANYTCIQKADDESLKIHIETHLPLYMEEVLFRLPKNTKESPESIRLLINHNALSDEQKGKFLAQQEYHFPDFKDVPEGLWTYLWENKKILVSWSNIANYLKAIEDEDQVITDLLQKTENLEALATEGIREAIEDEESRKELSRFLLENAELNDRAYCKLTRNLPYYYSKFPESLSKPKYQCLVESRTVRLAESSFAFTEGQPELRAVLIAKNFEEFTSEPEQYPLDDDIRSRLLTGEIGIQAKIDLAREIAPESVATNQQLAAVIASVIAPTTVDLSQFNSEVLSAAIIHATDATQSIQILTRCITSWSGESITQVLTQLSEPLSSIAVHGKRPKLKNTALNLEFVKALKAEDYISSYKEKKDFIEVNTYSSPDRSERQEENSSS